MSVCARAIGLTLQEIGEILTLRDDGQRPCAHVMDLLDQKPAAVERQLWALRDVRGVQQDLWALCEEALTSRTSANVCAIMQHRRRL